MRYRIDVNTLDGKVSFEKEAAADALEAAQGSNLGVTITDGVDHLQSGRIHDALPAELSIWLVWFNSAKRQSIIRNLIELNRFAYEACLFCSAFCRKLLDNLVRPVEGYRMRNCIYNSRPEPIRQQEIHAFVLVFRCEDNAKRVIFPLWCEPAPVQDVYRAEAAHSAIWGIVQVRRRTCRHLQPAQRPRRLAEGSTQFAPSVRKGQPA